MPYRYSVDTINKETIVCISHACMNECIIHDIHDIRSTYRAKYPGRRTRVYEVIVVDTRNTKRYLHAKI